MTGLRRTASDRSRRLALADAAVAPRFTEAPPPHHLPLQQSRRAQLSISISEPENGRQRR
jgi:hypothetical protein